jgi:hypothetical protein
VFENNHMQNDSYANSRRKETRRSFVFSRQSDFQSSLNSPTDPVVYVNPSCDTARLLRPNCEAERCHNRDTLLYHDNYVGNTSAPTRHYRCSEDTNPRQVIPGDPPPDYQQALVMQRPKTVPKGSQQPSLPLPRTRIVIEENAYLQSVPNRRNYHTIMETSL